MQRLFLVLAFVVVAAAALAQNTSTTQMQLVKSDVFTNRLQYLMAQQAATVLTEAASDAVNADTFARYSAACHTLRKNYALLVIQFPAEYASKASVPLSGANFPGGVIIATVVANADPKLVDSSANDTALAKAITDSWNTLAGCFTFS